MLPNVSEHFLLWERRRTHISPLVGTLLTRGLSRGIKTTETLCMHVGKHAQQHGHLPFPPLLGHLFPHTNDCGWLLKSIWQFCVIVFGAYGPTADLVHNIMLHSLHSEAYFPIFFPLKFSLFPEQTVCKEEDRSRLITCIIPQIRICAHERQRRERESCWMGRVGGTVEIK